MISGGVHFHGLSDLLLLEGTMNEFSYAQALFFYKDNIEEIKKNQFIKSFSNKMGQNPIQVLTIKNS